MAVKAKNRKKAKMTELVNKSIKIKCCYCDLNGKCRSQTSKEKSESLGIITYCTLTPNVPTKKRKKSKDIKRQAVKPVKSDKKRG